MPAFCKPHWRWQTAHYRMREVLRWASSPVNMINLRVLCGIADTSGGVRKGRVCTLERSKKMARTADFYPRLSEARHLLPLLRSHLVAAASRYPLPAGLMLELLPIVEDGLFGYELVPDRNTHTYVTIGCNAQGEPRLRRTSLRRRCPQHLAAGGRERSQVFEKRARVPLQPPATGLPLFRLARRDGVCMGAASFPLSAATAPAGRPARARAPVPGRIAVDRLLASRAVESRHPVLRAS